MTYDKTYAREVLGADCDNCPLRVGGRFVPSHGDPHSDLAIVGEAPGVQEAIQGVPFVGPSGKLLNIVMSKNGLNKEEAFLTNACLCRPADGKTPPKTAIAACRPRLLAELGGTTGTVVALGNSAALGVLGVEGVTKLRVGPGKTSPYKELEGRRVIPTVHPAACLRQSDMFPSLVADIGKVGAPDVHWIEPEYKVLDDPASAIEELRYIESRADDLVIDIEVDIDKDTSYDHPNRYGLLSVGLCYEEGRAVVIGERALEDDDVRRALADALRASYVIAHNGKFDLAGLNPVLGTIAYHFCTMLASYCFDERPGIHGLEQLGIEYLGTPDWKGVTKQYTVGGAGYGNIPRDILYKYNAFDAVVTWLLYKFFKKKLQATAKPPAWWEGNYPYKSLMELHDFLVEHGNELIFLELNGIKIDKTYIAELTDMYMEKLAGQRAGINKVLTDAGYNEINPNSPQQVTAALAFLKCKVQKTDKDTLNAIIDTLEERGQTDKPLYHFTEQLLVYRRDAKLFSTYVKGVTKRLYRGRVYSTFSLHGSTTGRLASRNPNLQNIVREAAIKRLYIPGRPENLFVQADYSQAELRVLTWLAQDPYFREILNDPSRDIFDELTPILYPNLGTKQEVGDEAWKEVRIRVKAFVYGLGYGRTEFSIAKEYKLPVSEAQTVKNRFFDAIPAIVDWQAHVKDHVKKGRDLISPFGRHRRFHLITNENWKSVQNEALAFLPQSTSSDVCLRAMGRVRRDIRGSGAFVRNIVHDSILVDSPPDMASDIADLLDRHMLASAQELVGDYVSFKTDTKIGTHWGEV